MTTEKTEKNAKNYCCNKCYFNTCNKTDFSRHLTTQKHKNNVSTTDDNVKNVKKYICENCEKEYNDRPGLWRHKKKCQETNFKIDKDEVTDKELIMTLLKQNSQLIEQNAELTKNGINNTTISNNTNSLNKTFNLQFFLNETCKDAMNIMDFVDSIKLQLTDLEKVGQIGYVEGISNIITTNLKALDVTQRPIHCTDKKRETLYIKDEDKWEKENEEKKKLRKVIKKVANKNIMLLQKFKEAHPDCGKSASKYSDQYNKIIIESMDTDKENEDKIIKNISNVTIIDK
jgi:hypothetical protein